MKMAESSPNGYKILWEKEKLLVTSNFSLSHFFFQETFTTDTLKPGLVWEMVKIILLLNLETSSEFG